MLSSWLPTELTYMHPPLRASIAAV